MTTPPADNSGVRVFPPGLYAGGFLFGLAAEWTRPLPLLPGHPTARWVLGGLLVLAFLPLSLAAIRLFFRAGNHPNPTLPVKALVVTGPYRFTRNPMYLGLALLYAGLAVLLDSVWPLVLLVPVLVLIRRLVIDREEAYLARTFGAAYQDYTRRVRRWI